MQFFSRLVGIFVLVAATLSATSIGSYSLDFNGSSIGAGIGNANANIVAGTGSEIYQVAGTLDVYDLTTGLPVTGLPLAGGFALRFTNAIISCQAPGSACGPTFMTFAAVIFLNPSAPASLTGRFGVEGSGVGAGVITAIANDLGNSNFLTIADVSTSGAFSESVVVPAFFTAGATNMQLYLSMALQIGSGLADGHSITLPDSLYFQIGQTAVPEPGTTALVAGGLLGTLWFRRRLK